MNLFFPHPISSLDSTHRYKVTIDPLAHGEVECSHYATQIAVLYPSRTPSAGADGAGAAVVAREEYIAADSLVPAYQIVLTAREPLLDNRGFTQPLRSETERLLRDKEHLWHEVHIVRGGPTKVTHIKSTTHGGDHSPPPVRSPSPFAPRKSGANAEPPTLRDAGPAGSTLLARARQLCEADSTAAGGWAVVGTPPTMGEVATQLIREFGRPAVERHEAAVREMVEANVAVKNPRAAAERDHARRLRCIVKLAPWVGMTTPMKEPDPVHLAFNSCEPVLGGANSVKIIADRAAAALCGFDFGAVQRLLDEEREEAARFDDILAVREAEVSAAACTRMLRGCVGRVVVVTVAVVWC